MILLSGKPVADKILRGIRSRIKAHGITPGLAIILVGEDPASHLYVNLKVATAAKVGVHLEKYLLPASSHSETILEAIKRFNTRPDIHGIIVQLPLPEGLPTDKIISTINPEKDTDGFHPATLERFLAGDITACPVFPRAVFELLLATGQKFQGKTGLVLANSDILGKMMGQILSSFGMTGDYILSAEDRGLREDMMKKADVIVSACGIPGLITGDLVKSGVVIIDGGITEQKGVAVGDVERESTEIKAAFLSPVPGGVGPVTVACLLARVTEATLSSLGEARATIRDVKKS